MQVELRAIDSIQPYERNPRENDGAVDAVAASLKEFGFRQPIVVDSDGVIICGHTRMKAARKLGLKKVPVHVATDLSPDQVKALRVADNKTGELATWDFEILPIELADLQAMEFDMLEFGFDEDELAKLLSEEELVEGLTDPESIPEPPDEPVTQPGDLWILGDHRLLCGDSSKEADVDTLLNGNSIDMVNTDPPYNVSVQPRSNNAVAMAAASKGATKNVKKQRTTKMRPKDRPLANDFVSDEEFDRLLDAWFGNISRVLKPGGIFFIWGGYANLSNYPPMLKKNGLYFSQSIIWNKLHPVLTRKDFMGAFELCFYGWKEGAGHKYYGPNNATDLWEVKKINPNKMVHLTQKPTELATRALQYSSKKGANVLELFGGSGSTLIGCEQTGRHCFAMEIDPAYCDVIVERWGAFTGKKAELVREAVPTGETSC